MRIYGLTDTGRVREGNEDAFGIDESRHLGVLADGMGGLNAGEVASRLAVDEFLAQMGDSPSAARMNSAMVAANTKVHRLSQEQGAWHNMGTTLVACALDASDQWVIGHVGDSRAYLLRGDELVQVTRDHSVVQEMLDQGMLNAEEARVASNRHIITRAIGLEAKVSVDVTTLPMQAQDLILLCSDGLSDMVADAVLTDLLVDRESIEGAAAQLLACANRAGGTDNITAVLISV